MFSARPWCGHPGTAVRRDNHARAPIEWNARRATDKALPCSWVVLAKGGQRHQPLSRIRLIEINCPRGRARARYRGRHRTMSGRPLSGGPEPISFAEDAKERLSTSDAPPV